MINLQKSILISTAYLPPIEYFQYLLNSEKQIIEKHETYKKQTYRNRCYILGSNGKLALSIPVKKPHGNNTKTQDIQISYDENWQQIHWRSIESSYNSSPFFLFYKDEVKQFYQKKHKYLIDYNDEFMKLIFELLDVEIHPEYTKKFIKKPKDILDLRNSISPKLKPQTEEFKEYLQVFSTKLKFIPNLSIIDLIFNTGPEANSYLYI